MWPAHSEELGMLNHAADAVQRVGGKGLHQLYASYSPQAGELLLNEVWVSFETGWSRRQSKRVPVTNGNPLENGFPEDATPFTHGLWVTAHGRLSLRGTSGEWTPVFFGEANLPLMLHQLSRGWRTTWLTRQSPEATCCEGNAGNEVAFPPIADGPATDTWHWVKDRYQMDFELARGLIREGWTTVDGIVTERVHNDFPAELDLTPPAELRAALAAMPRATRATDVEKAPADLPAHLPFAFGFAFAKIPGRPGLMITRVSENSPAHLGGLHPYDWLLKIDGTRVEDLPEDATATLAKKDSVVLTVRSGDQDRQVTLQKVATETYAAKRR